MIYLFNQQEQLIATFSNDNKNASEYFKAQITEELNGPFTLELEIPADSKDAPELLENRLVVLQDRNQKWQAFYILELEEIHSGQWTKRAVCEHAIAELNDDIKDIELDRRGSALALQEILTGTRWEVGHVEATDTHSFNKKAANVLESLSTFSERWGLELEYRVDISGQEIVHRYIDAVKRRGNETGKRFEYNKDMTSVRRTIDATQVKTALIAYGNERDDGTLVTFKEIHGKNFVEDDEARIKYGRVNNDGSFRHRYGVFELDTDDPEELLIEAQAALEETKNPLAEYELSVLDLARTLGQKHEEVAIGDTIKAKDKELDITLKARVIKMEYDLTEPEQATVTLGNIMPIQSMSVENRIKQVESVLKGTARKEDLEKKANAEVLSDLEEALGQKLDSDDYHALVEAIGDKADQTVVDDIETILGRKVSEEELNEIRQILNNKLDRGESIRTSWLQGEINALRNKVLAGEGTVQLTENDGILIVDDPENPTQALRLLGGMLALANEKDPVTGLWNWRSFGTAEGWLGDLVETGFLKFDRSKGGILELGGNDDQNGVFIVRNSRGENIAELSGDYGGFGTLNIDELHNTQNVIFKTYNDTENNDGMNIHYYVNPYDGDDNNSGTETAPLASVQVAIDRLPKYLSHNVFIYMSAGLLNDNEIRIEGFMGTGEIFLQNWTRTVRYIRNFANGSDSNDWTHWLEVHAVTDDGVIRDGRLRDDAFDTNITSPNDTPITEVSNDRVSLSYYYATQFRGAEPWYVDVYLFAGLTNVERVKVWHYYGDNRTYKQTKTQVGPNKSDWTTIFDSEREGTYPEQAEGKSHFVNKSYLQGKVVVKSNMNPIEIQDLFIDQSETSSRAVEILNGAQCNIRNCVLFGNTNESYTLYAHNQVQVGIFNTEVNTAARTAIMAAYGASLGVYDCTGSGAKYGLEAFSDSVIAGYGSCPYGSTNAYIEQYGGEVKRNFVGKTGEFSPVTITEQKQTWTNTDAQTYAEHYNAWDTLEKDVRQGKWDQYGPYRGLWLFGSDMRNTVSASGIKIKQIKVYVTRKNSAGYSSAVPIYLKPHGYSTRPSGIPYYKSPTVTVNLARGEAKWVDCTSAFKSIFESGDAYGIGTYTTNTSNAVYARMTGSAKVQIVYEKAI